MTFRIRQNKTQK